MPRGRVTLETPPANVPSAGPRGAGADQLVRALELLAQGFLTHPANDELRRLAGIGELTAIQFKDELTWIALRLIATRIGALREQCVGVFGNQPPELVDTALRHVVDLCSSSWTPILSGCDPLCRVGRPASIAERDITAAICVLAEVVPESATVANHRHEFNPEQFGAMYERLLACTPVWFCNDQTGARSPYERLSLRLMTAPRGERNRRGAFYTPPRMVKWLIEDGLEPLLTHLDDRRSLDRGVLDLRVCDPSCGTGNVLLAAARTLSLAAGKAKVDQAGGGPLGGVHAAVGPEVITSCLYGVDIDPIAVALCQIALWCEACGQVPLAVIAERIKCGDSLLGTTRELVIGRSQSACSKHGQDGIPLSARSSIDYTHTAADEWCRGVLGETWDEPSVRDISRQFFHWDLEFPDVFRSGGSGGAGFDAVIGNPPFLNQLESLTASDRGASRLYAARLGLVRPGYADAAFLFLLLSVRLATSGGREGGRVSLVQPQSLLASRDAQPIRAELLRHASLTNVRVCSGREFAGASVWTCIPSLRIGSKSAVEKQHRFPGPRGRPASGRLRAEADPSETWSHMAATAIGVPQCLVRSDLTVGSIAQATADFRDEYYGLRGFLIEESDLPSSDRDQTLFPRVVTSGLIDPSECLWGRRSARIHKTVWRRPCADAARLQAEGTLGAWLSRRLCPKAVLATQTRVLEVFVDERGTLLPSTPLISVVPHSPGDVWLVGAALSSPVATVLARTRFGGTALSFDAIKLSAKQAMSLPLPHVRAEWEHAAELFRSAHACDRREDRLAMLEEFAELAANAYGLASAERAAVNSWWKSRLFTSRERRSSAQRADGDQAGSGAATRMLEASRKDRTACATARAPGVSL